MCLITCFVIDNAYIALTIYILLYLPILMKSISPKPLLARLLSLAFVLLLMGSSCKKEEIEIDPHKAILGKWEITHDSYGPIQKPIAYEEYLPDSILMNYIYEEETFVTKRYWFADSLLYQERVYIDQTTDDTLLVDIQPYKYKFLDRNTLQLDMQYFFMNTYSRYKRIE